MKLNQIAFRYLKGQKKHTVMTIIAVIISTAFLTVLLSAVSVYRATALNSAEQTYGTYHVLFNGLDKQSMIPIRSMDIFEKTEIYSVSSYSSSVDMDFGQMRKANAAVEYLVLQGNLADDNFLRIKAEDLTMLPEEMFSVTEGRLPEKNGEIVISARSAYMWDYPAVGDTVEAQLVVCKAKDGNVSGFEDIVPEILTESFDIESADTITFQVVGISEEYNFVDYSDTQLKSYSYLSDNMLARFSEDTNDLYWDMHYAFADAGLEIDDFTFGMNQQLLDLEGKGVTAKFSQAMFFALMYLAIVFIMFCVRLVIDNAFEISAKERVKQFGLLKSAGASRKQILSLTLWEAVYLAVPGVIAGIILGAACARWVFSALVSFMSSGKAMDYFGLADMLEFDLQPYVFISAAVIGVLWVCVSAVATGMRMINASPVEAMRYAGKKDKLSVPKNPKKSGKDGSFISSYSTLSIKRNKKRYFITMISMVLSITMFTGFSYGMSIGKGNLEKEFDSLRAPYDYTADYSAFTPYSVSDETQKMLDTGYFTDVQYDAYITLFGDMAALGVPETSELYQWESTVINVHPVNRGTFEKYINTGVSYDELLSSGGIIISNRMMSTHDDPVYDIYGQIPQSVTAAPFNSSMLTFFDEITVSVLGEYSTDNRTYFSVDGIITAVVPEETYISMVEELVVDNYSYSYTDENGEEYYVFLRQILANAAEGFEEQAENYMEMHYFGRYQNSRADMSRAYALLEAIRFLGYFVIAIISLIAVVNIVNIISANVLNRTSELAMLRACGMSDKQLHGLVFREGTIYAGMAGLISLIITELAIFVIRLPYVTHFEDMTFDDIGFEPSFIQPIPYILIAVLVSFAVAAAASWFPAQRIIRTPIVENIETVV